MMFNYAWKGEEAWKTGIYSPHKAKEVAWSRHYASFWNESMAFCEMFLPELTQNSPEIEMKLLHGGDGKQELLRRHHAHRPEDLDHGALDPDHAGAEPGAGEVCSLHVQARRRLHDFLWGSPHLRKRQVADDAAPDMYLDEKGVEDFKTHFYALEGWDTAHGWPTRKTLEDFGLKHVADTMAAKNRLGA